MAERQIAAYFSAQAFDRKRIHRAEKHGYQIVDQTIRSGRTIDPLGSIRSWSDNDPETVGLEMREAKKHGIGTFIACIYAGQSNGENATESEEVANIIADQAEKNDMNFAFMFSFRRPPNRIPYPIGDEPEPDRYFDLSLETLFTMKNFASKYWHNKKYLKLYGDRPFTMIYGLTPQIIDKFRNQSDERNRLDNIGTIFSLHNTQGEQFTPFLIGVVDAPDMAQTLMEQGFDATTAYAGLPTFYERALKSEFGACIDTDDLPRIQNYDAQLLLQQSFAETHLLNGGQKYYPSSVAGWKPILRCDSKVYPADYPPEYPYAPWILDSTPKKFLNMMLWTWLYYGSMISSNSDEFPYIMCSFNDIDDGSDILYGIRPDGSIDDGYLEAVKTFYDFVHSPYPHVFIEQLAAQGRVRPELVPAVDRVLAKQHNQVIVPIPRGPNIKGR